MWIGAHPDDEAVVAPLLMQWCVLEGAQCTFLVLTRGEAGACLRAGGCLPDVASVRAAEAGAAAELFHANSIHLRHPDGGGVTLPAWNAIETIAGYVEAVRPELILTFDPAHGTTGHPDHRETGRSVVEAVRKLTYDPKLYFLETRVIFGTDPLVLRFVSASDEAVRYDARATWDAIARDMERHPSQFDAQWFAAVASVPQEERAVFIQAAPPLR